MRVNTTPSHLWEKSWTNLNQHQLEALACRLAPLLKTGDVIFLHGDLGAGKSTFARALIRQTLNDKNAEVPSPTYTLVQSYEPENALPLWHYDLYRLSGVDDVYELGMDDALDQGAALIEWPERLEGTLTPSLNIHLSAGKTPETRTITASATSEMAQHLADWGRQ